MIRLVLSLCMFAGCVMTTSAAPARPSGREVVSTRDMDRINWMEFREVVPAKIETVLLPTGTLEPHGVTANGADNIAPAAIAREIADDVNALIAPTLAFGITGSMSN